MVHGTNYYLRQAWKKPSLEMLRERMIAWRESNAIVKVERPLRIDRARALGYKAKRGIIILRVRVKRGGRKRERKHVKGRKSRKQTNRKTLKMNYRWVAEIRAARRYPTLEVLNSYNIGQDGKNYFFEIIMIDPTKPEIQNDRTLKWIIDNRKRAERGLTSAAKKSRGLRSKSPKMKVRPSLRAWNRQGK
ncbi:50S ribosomal protein L15e [Candidatus Pacearchaeota archaeon]|nr:50S ribosomal protein L15e [Candidatus Pacearchaeota archaeon]